MDVFDTRAREYDAVHNKVLSLSGEESNFFVDEKLRLLARALSKRVNEPLRILDYGCGTGRLGGGVRKYISRARVWGIDPSKESIRVAKETYPECTFSVLSTSSFRDMQFDVIILAVVLHHVDREDHVKTLERLRACLAPQGRVFIFEHNPKNPLTVHVVKNCEFDKGVTLLSAEYASKMMTSAGYIVTTVQYYFFFPRWLKWLRRVENVLAIVPLGAQYMMVAERNT